MKHKKIQFSYLGMLDRVDVSNMWRFSFQKLWISMKSKLEAKIWYKSFSLSKCLKYPGFIFLCPQKLSKKNPRKKTKSLNYPNTIPKFFSEFGYVQDFFYVPRTILGKKQTPWTTEGSPVANSHLCVLLGTFIVPWM